MKVNEIFSSIEGEGIRQGFLCTFVRFYGCRLHCSYCDTRYACEGGEYEQMSVAQVIQRVESLGNRRLTLTGGEPLLQSQLSELVQQLLTKGFAVNIETSGSVDYSLLWDDAQREHWGDRLILTVDSKSPSSGMKNLMKEQCLINLKPWDVLKFVVGTTEDLADMLQVLSTYHPKSHIFVGAVFDQISPMEIVEFLQKHHLQQVRLQLQIHKYIWDPDARGV